MKLLNYIGIPSPRASLLAATTAALIGGGALVAPEANAVLFFDELFGGQDRTRVETTAGIRTDRMAGDAYADPDALELPTAAEASVPLEGELAYASPLQGDIPTSDQSPSVDEVDQADN